MVWPGALWEDSGVSSSREHYQPPGRKQLLTPQELFGGGQLPVRAVEPSGSQCEGDLSGKEAGYTLAPALPILSSVSAANCLNSTRSPGEGCSSIPFIPFSHLRHQRCRRMESGPDEPMEDDQQTSLTKNQG